MSHGDVNERLTAIEGQVGKILKTGVDVIMGGGLNLRKVTAPPVNLPDGRIWHLGSNLFARLAGATETIAVLSKVVLKSSVPATRYIDFAWDTIGTATKASDVHSGAGGFGTHLDMADATNYTIDFQPQTVPADFNGTGRLELWLSTPAVAGNYYLDFDIRELANGFANESTTYAAAAFAVATAAVVDQSEIVSTAVQLQPVAGRLLLLQVQMLGANALDTLTAQRTLWKARIAYTPTL